MSATGTPSVRRPPARTVPAAEGGQAVLRWLGAAALASAAAGALHLVAAARYAGAGELAVGFFLAVAVVQVGSAAWLTVSARCRLVPQARHLLLVMGGTVGLLVLFLVAETTALLDAFLAPGNLGQSHAHDGTVPVDPVTGLVFSAGIPVDGGGPVAMAGDPATTTHRTGALGAATAAAELLAVGALAALLPRAWRSRAFDGLFALGVAVWVLWFTGVLR